jgi:5'-3' exonuclease
MTKKKYIVVDGLNTFMRSKHQSSRSSSLEENIAFSIHLMFSMIGKCWRQFNADHIVICTEGRSWRKEVYKPYKANRAAQRAALTQKEIETDEKFFNAFSDWIQFLTEKTNCTILRHPEAEADDMIARWIATTPNADHIIISSDSDYYQLISDNVTQYNGITDEYITLNGVFRPNMTPIIDKKTNELKTIGDPEWVLFEKCMRGDTSDNIFSAYPGVRAKSSKNKVGLIEAYENRHLQGFAWNTVMQHTWSDHLGVEHKVGTDYNRNVMLVDLSKQPEELKVKFDSVITESKSAKKVSMVGLHFLKFCGKYDLNRLSENPKLYTDMLAAQYTDED